MESNNRRSLLLYRLYSFRAIFIQTETLVFPAPSAAIEYLRYNFDDLLEELEIFTPDDTRMCHRRADPLDMNLTLPMDASLEEVKQWCGRIISGKFAKEFSNIAAELDGPSLYAFTLPDLIRMVEDKGEASEHGMALCFYIHLWQSSMRGTPEYMLELARKDVESMGYFTFYELHSMKKILRRSGEKEIYRECQAQARFLNKLQNRFAKWQLKNNLPLVLI